MKWFCFLLYLSSLSAWGLEVQGHRGARALRPENTLPAFEYALVAGVDVLELDLQVTKDGVLVVSHDPNIPEHCMNAKGEKGSDALLIHNLTLAEVQAWDCGRLPNPRFPKQIQIPHTPMPRFLDVLRLVKDSQTRAAKTVQLNVETKLYPAFPERSPAPRVFAKLVIDALKSAAMVARATLESFDDRSLLIAHKLEPKLRTVLLTSDNHFDYVKAVRAAHAWALSPDYQWLLPEDVAALHKAGIKVIPWTANDPLEWKKLIAMKVDGIITDDPAALIEYLIGAGLRKRR